MTIPSRVGCPIRISTDQSLLAAPRGFSQRATSFIASWCQGIHRMPLFRSRSLEPVPKDRREPITHRSHPHAKTPHVNPASTQQATILSNTHVGPTGLINRRITTTSLNVDALLNSQTIRKDRLKQQNPEGPACRSDLLNTRAPRDAPEPDSH